MSYQVVGKSGRVEKSFLKIIKSFSEDEQAKMWHILLEYPEGSATTHWTIKKVGKDIWQLDLPDGYRLEYSVIGTVVLVLFIGNHDAAAAFLRRKR